MPGKSICELKSTEFASCCSLSSLVFWHWFFALSYYCISIFCSVVAPACVPAKASPELCLPWTFHSESECYSWCSCCEYWRLVALLYIVNVLGLCYNLRAFLCCSLFQSLVFVYMGYGISNSWKFDHLIMYACRSNSAWSLDSNLRCGCILDCLHLLGFKEGQGLQLPWTSLVHWPHGSPPN